MRAQLERDQSLQRLRQSESGLNDARHDLADAIGLPASEIARRPAGDDCLPAAARESEPLADLQTRAITSRLDLRAKLAEYRAVDATFRTEVKRRMPDLNLGPGYTYDQGDRRLTFTLSAELPIFSHNDAAIARAAADRDRVIAEVDQLQWSVRSGVERAVDQLALGRQQFADSQRVAGEAQDLLARDRQRLASGELDQPTVIASELISNSARASMHWTPRGRCSRPSSGAGERRAVAAHGAVLRRRGRDAYHVTRRLRRKTLDELRPTVPAE